MTNTDILKIGVNQKSFPEHINKYRADGEHTENIIKTNQLWFANPLEFNDPYDCNTPINVNTQLNDIKNWLKSVGIHQQYIDSLATQLKANPNLMKDSTESALSKSGVCCFSTLEDNILQWSHYSDYHKGICLKFNITKDPDFFMIPIIVSYRRVMQHYNHFIQAAKIIEYLIQPKYFECSYESEIRIVKTEVAMKANKMNRAFKFKDEALEEVIFGAKATQATIEKYKDLCNKNSKQHVKFNKMKLGTGLHYELIKERL